MVTDDKAHGRLERRELWASSQLNDYLDFPHVGQVFVLQRTRVIRSRDGQSKTEFDRSVGITSLSPDRADPARLLALSRGHWAIENKLHWVRDVTFDEDRSQVRSGHGPQILAALRNTTISLVRLAGSNAIRPALRALASRPDDALRLLGIPRGGFEGVTSYLPPVPQQSACDLEPQIAA